MSCELFRHSFYHCSVWIILNWWGHAALGVSDNAWPFVQVVSCQWPSLRRRWVMLVFMSPSWERKPAEKRDEGEAQAGVRVSSHGPAHDQMKERYLFWHHTGGGRAAPESAVGVSGIEEECRWGLDTYLHVYQLAQVQKPEFGGVLLCGVMIKEFNVGQSASWQAVSHFRVWILQKTPQKALQWSLCSKEMVGPYRNQNLMCDQARELCQFISSLVP